MLFFASQWSEAGVKITMSSRSDYHNTKKPVPRKVATRAAKPIVKQIQKVEKQVKQDMKKVGPNRAERRLHLQGPKTAPVKGMRAQKVLGAYPGARFPKRTIPKVTNNGENERVIEYEEYLGVIQGSKEFQANSYRVNPGQPYPFAKISQDAKDFQDYTCSYMELVFQTKTSDTASGTIMFSFFPDPDAAPPTDKTTMMNLNCKTDKYVAKLETRLHIAETNFKKMQTYKIRNANQVPEDGSYLLYDLGWITIATEGTVSQNGEALGAIGDLFLKAKFVCKTPSLKNLDEYGSEMTFVSDNPTNDNPLGLSRNPEFISSDFYSLLPITVNYAVSPALATVIPIDDLTTPCGGFIFKCLDKTQINVSYYYEGNALTGTVPYHDGKIVPGAQTFGVMNTDNPSETTGYVEYKTELSGADGGGIQPGGDIDIDPKYYGFNMFAFNIGGTAVENFASRIIGSQAPFHPDFDHLFNESQEDLATELLKILTPKQVKTAKILIEKDKRRRTRNHLPMITEDEESSEPKVTHPDEKKKRDEDRMHVKGPSQIFPKETEVPWETRVIRVLEFYGEDPFIPLMLPNKINGVKQPYFKDSEIQRLYHAVADPAVLSDYQKQYTLLAKEESKEDKGLFDTLKDVLGIAEMVGKFFV